MHLNCQSTTTETGSVTTDEPGRVEQETEPGQRRLRRLRRLRRHFWVETTTEMRRLLGQLDSVGCVWTDADQAGRRTGQDDVFWAGTTAKARRRLLGVSGSLRADDGGPGLGKARTRWWLLLLRTRTLN